MSSAAVPIAPAHWPPSSRNPPSSNGHFWIPVAHDIWVLAPRLTPPSSQTKNPRNTPHEQTVQYRSRSRQSDRNGEWLEVYYPQPLLNPNDTTRTALAQILNYTGGNQAIAVCREQMSALTQALDSVGDTEQADITQHLARSERPLVATLLATDSAPVSVPEAYLKLHLISHRLVKPHGTDLTGIFGILPNVAWTNEGAIDLEEVSHRQLQARVSGTPLEVTCVDKFPKLTDYVVPSGVRIADTARVRLGAYLGEGTTIMHEGFVNFNAGT